MPNHFADEAAVQERIRDFVRRAEEQGRGRLGVTVYAAPSKPDVIGRYEQAGVTRYMFYVESVPRDAAEERLDQLAGVVAQYRGVG
jgi:hypothetical protein